MALKDNFEKDVQNVKQQAKNAYADGKKKVKDAWVDTKAAAERSGTRLRTATAVTASPAPWFSSTAIATLMDGAAN